MVLVVAVVVLAEWAYLRRSVRIHRPDRDATVDALAIRLSRVLIGREPQLRSAIDMIEV